MLAVYGGRAYEPQVEALRKGVDVVVGTPGRLLDLARQRHLDLSGVRALVLDEADEMLDLGFLPDVESILELVPTARQTMLFSATMPGAGRRAVPPLPRPARCTSAPRCRTRAAPSRPPTSTSSAPTRSTRPRCSPACCRPRAAGCRSSSPAPSAPPTRSRSTSSERGFAAAAVHGDLGQGAREQALRAFRAGKIDILVATDVAARGIDVAGVTHVINYQCPEDEKIYLHRIGRTGRAGEKGVAVTFVDWDDLARWQMVNEALEAAVPGPAGDLLHLRSPLRRRSTSRATPRARSPRDQRIRAGLAAEQVEDLGETGRRGGKLPARARRPQEQAAEQHGAPTAAGRQAAQPQVRKRTRGARRRAADRPPTASDSPTAAAATGRLDRCRRRRPAPMPDGTPGPAASPGRSWPRHAVRSGEAASEPAGVAEAS